MSITVLTNWRDDRLQFTNLQTSTNVLKYQEWKNIWIPDFIIKDTKTFIETSNLADEHDSFIYLKLINSSQFCSKYETVRNDFYYEGENVEIYKDNKYTIDFICNFDWKVYPFDSQENISKCF